MALPLLAAGTDPLFLCEGNMDSVMLYTPDGQPADPLGGIAQDGYVVRTSGSDVVFTSVFGDITVSDGTILAITGYNLESPSLYLIDGSVTLDVNAVEGLNLYTPTSRYTIPGSGSYTASYTAESDRFTNWNGGDVLLYDALRRGGSTISSAHYSDLLAGLFNVPLYASPAEAQELGEEPVIIPEEEVPAVTGTPEEPVTATEEEDLTGPEAPVTTPVEPIVEEVLRGSHENHGINITYRFSDNGSGRVGYPADLVSDADLAAFAQAYLAYTSLPGLDEVSYRKVDGGLELSYPGTYTIDDIELVVDDVTFFLDQYLLGIFIPAAPQIISVHAQEDGTTPAAPAFSLVTTNAAIGVPSAPAFHEVSTEAAVPAAPAVPTYESHIEDLKKNQ